MKILIPHDPWLRLWKRLKLNPATGCMEFIGKRDKDGYGRMMVAGKWVRTHIFVFERKHGFRPPMVCHSCDNPPCCAEDHLFAGDQAINMADMVTKERGGGAKLTSKQVLEIRAVPCKYGSAKLLATMFGVNRDTIRAIRSGKTWKHLDTLSEAPAIQTPGAS